MSTLWRFASSRWMFSGVSAQEEAGLCIFFEPKCPWLSGGFPTRTVPVSSSSSLPSSSSSSSSPVWVAHPPGCKCSIVEASWSSSSSQWRTLSSWQTLSARSSCQAKTASSSPCSSASSLWRRLSSQLASSSCRTFCVWSSSCRRNHGPCLRSPVSSFE